MIAWPSVLSIINLFCAGTLVGVELASHYGFVLEPSFLGEADQVRPRQALIRRLRVLVPAVFAPALVSTIGLALLTRSQPGFALRCIALAGDAFWIHARIVATMRINAATLDWNPDTPPRGWRGLVARAERFHVASLWATVIDFLCLLVASQI